MINTLINIHIASLGMQPFLRTYQPKKLADIVDQDKAAHELKEFIINFKKQKKRCAFLHGPPGVGKTASVHAIAKELDLELIEVNASDARNADQINALLGAATKQQSLFSKGKVILMDEIDGLSGTKDRGGILELLKIITETAFPIVCTANNPYDQKFSTLRSKCLMIAFHHLQYPSIAKVLNGICVQEGIAIEKEVIDALARRAGGDLRAALNDLESIGRGKKNVVKKDLEALGGREQEETIINALLRIFKTTDPKVAIGALDNVNEDIDKVMLWIDENLPKEYKKPADLERAYEYMSKSDVFNRRIRRWQHWRFLVYINAFLTGGIAVSKEEKYHGFTQYKPTMRLLKIWQANQKYAMRKAIAQKIAAKTHTSAKRVIHDVLPYLKQTFKKGNLVGERIVEQYELTNEEEEWLASWQ